MKRAARRIVLVLVVASALYGATFQQLRHFDIRAPHGSSDARSYIAISHGNWDVPPVRRYRPVVPALAAVVRAPLAHLIADPVELDKLAFYVVNFVFALATALLLFATLSVMGFDWKLALLGVMFFVTSRVTVASVGTPMVDSLYFLAVGIIVHLTLTGRATLLAFTMPLLVVSKETILPFFLLPLASRSTRGWKIVASIIVSLGVFGALRVLVDHEVAATRHVPLEVIVAGLAQSNVLESLRRLLHPAGVHDLLHGFGILGLLAPVGFFLERRHRKWKIPGFVLLPIPIAFGFALVSNNLGRMFFAAYVPVIAYSLVMIEYLFDGIETSR